MAKIKVSPKLKHKNVRLLCDEWDDYTEFIKGIKIVLRDFDLHGKSVSFYFHVGNCHVIRDSLNRCSLHLHDVTDLEQHKETDKSNPKHCPYVLQLMTDFPKRMFPIYLYKYRCGHYSMGQGQHRICISGTLGKQIPIVRLGFNNRVDCGACSEPDQYIFKKF